MFLSRHPKSQNYYVYYFTPNGKRRSVSTGCKLKKDAIRFLSDFQAKQRARNADGLEAVTLKNYAWEYLKESERTHRPATVRDVKHCVTTFRAHIGGKVLLHHIETADVQTYLNKRLKKSVYGAKNARAYLRSFFNRAIELGHITDNPVQKTRPIKTPERMPTYFSREEFNELLEVIDSGDFRDVVLFAANTGLRLSELVNLQRPQVDLNSRLIILDNQHTTTKSGKVRSIPLNDAALQAVLRALDRSEREHVFTLAGEHIRAEYLSKKFKKYIRQAGLNDRLHFHSLRHSFASWLVREGVPLFSVSKLLGHSSLEVTQIYSHVTQDALTEAVNSL